MSFATVVVCAKTGRSIIMDPVAQLADVRLDVSKSAACLSDTGYHMLVCVM